jgi:nucleoside-diphosphate-sugar epimerase
MLLDEGFDVTILDRFFFGRQSVEDISDRARLVQGDIRWADSSVLRGVDAVIDMAALSNDPVGELNPEMTLDINYRSRVRMAKLARKHGVRRYLLASSTSVYGLKKRVCTEGTRIHPLTTYAKANALWEAEALPLANRKFCVTALRQSSVYGISKRMRFDIAFNNMVLSLFKGEKLPIMRDGSQVRPIIHIKDTSRAFITVLKADPEVVNGQVFNAGSNDQNFQIFELARMAAKSVGVPFRYEWYGSPDFRSYTVNFDKIRTTLGFKPKFAPPDGAREVFNGLKKGTITSDEKTVTIQWYKRLHEFQRLVHDVELRGRIL